MSLRAEPERAALEPAPAFEYKGGGAAATGGVSTEERNRVDAAGCKRNDPRRWTPARPPPGAGP